MLSKNVTDKQQLLLVVSASLRQQTRTQTTVLGYTNLSYTAGG